jgi:oxidase EvaA
MNNSFNDLMKSWISKEGLHSKKYILDWINERNNEVSVEVNPVSFLKSDFWFYDLTEGSIKNKNDAFFSIKGIQVFKNNLIIAEQPIIIQNEIGFLGIICQKIS